MPTPTLSPSSDIAAEVRQLESALADAQRQAEASRRTNADEKAADICNRLEAKRSELAQVEKVEAKSADADRHAQQLAALDEITSDEREAKATILDLQRQLASLPGRLAKAQHRHGELLRAKSLIKKSLGIA